MYDTSSFTCEYTVCIMYHVVLLVIYMQCYTWAVGDLRASPAVDATPCAFASATISELGAAAVLKAGAPLPGALFAGVPAGDGDAHPWFGGTRGGPRAVAINCETPAAADAA